MSQPIIGPNGQPVMSEQAVVPQMVIGTFQQIFMGVLPSVAVHYLQEYSSELGPGVSELIVDDTATIAIAAVKKLFNSQIKIDKKGDEVDVRLVEPAKAEVKTPVVKTEVPR